MFYKIADKPTHGTNLMSYSRNRLKFDHINLLLKTQNLLSVFGSYKRFHQLSHFKGYIFVLARGLGMDKRA